MPVLNISPHAEFYIAICAYKLHSFIMLGVKDKSSDNPILCAIGKAANLKAPWYSLEHFLQRERWLWWSHKREKEISYKAFSITFDQYEIFLELLRQYVGLTQKGTRAYVRKGWTFDDKIKYKAKRIEANLEPFSHHINAEEIKKIKASAQRNSANNSCRHTAIKLLDAILEPGAKGKDVSTLCFKKLPFTGLIRAGRISSYLFILPPPPDKNALSKEKYEALSLMYAQLEQIPKKYKNHLYTQSKFSSLKNLYNKLNTQPELDFSAFLKNIISWEEKNESMINTHRRRFFIFGKTATRTMLDKIKKLKP